MLLKKYKYYIYKKIIFGIILIIFLIFFSILGISIGDYNISFSKVIEALFGLGNDTTKVVVWNIRLPRVLAAILAGISLSISGAVMQCILRNPLASPFTLGISHGAMFGAALAILLLGFGDIKNEIIINNPYIITIFAFLGSLISVKIILILSKLRNFTPEAMILAGVAISSLFTAGTMTIQYFADELKLAMIVAWSFGDLGRINWNELYIIFVVLLFSFVYFMHKRWDFNALESGDEVAKSLGVDIYRLRLISMLISSILVSVNVAFLGIIGFVGLISPHIVRMVIGGDYRFLIPLSSLFGAVLLLCSDIVSRTIISPVVLPVGIITSFLGAPMLIYLLIKIYK